MNPNTSTRAASSKWVGVSSLAAVLAILALGLWAMGSREAHAQTPSAAPTGAEVSGRTWCINVSAKKPSELEQRVAALLDAGGQVVGYTYAPAAEFSVYLALICGKLTK